jgi:hypothetical protein
MTIPPYFKLHIASEPAPGAVVRSGQARFTVLSAHMVRLEYHPQAQFEDRPSQVFWHRSQPVPEFSVDRTGGELVIRTSALELHYREGSPFAAETLWIRAADPGARWRFGTQPKDNLLGTTRTLDMANGGVPLEPGLLNRSGWTVVDDSASLVFDSQGWLTERVPGGVDVYFWAYGKDYRLGMAEYYRLAGKPGLVPRWALGNWWSRYWNYTAEELQALMEEFRRRQIPLGVCIVDMDWHLTETGNGCSGWTGYTWNEKLFPDPPGFMGWLHAQGLKTGLNLHPAEGVWPHEAMYPEMARAVGIDPASQEPVRFAIENPVFVKAYFEYLHHPKEAEGVDFWWVDWQQGNPSQLKGLNLLWWINHLHYLDAGREKHKRPFLFSRWGGLGNHRYPIGFSGDTVVTWDSLAFQPYMTATAANVGYSWWSHDIGGHMGGIEEGELYTRWVQYGAFSPILRLHSTKNPHQERRPWGFDANTAEAARQAMVLRHQLIPYIYSMAWKDHQEGLPLVRPLYHLEPEREEAYASPNLYAFGTELLAAPFTTPIEAHTRLARQVVWLPGEGSTWYGWHNQRAYAGGCWHALYGGLQELPVFARQGAILPLSPAMAWGGIELPPVLELHIFPGASNRFELYEDDGESQAYLDGAYAITPIETSWDSLPGEQQPGLHRLRIHLRPVQGAAGLLPQQRGWRLVIHAVESVEPASVYLNGQPLEVAEELDAGQTCLRLGEVVLKPEDALMIELVCRESLGSGLGSEVRRLAKSFRLETDTRTALYDAAQELAENPFRLADYAAGLEKTQLRALLETLTGAGMDFQRFGGKQAPLRGVAWNNHHRPEIGFVHALDREVLFMNSLRFAAVGDLETGSRVFWPEKEILSGKALWALSYGSLLRLEEVYRKPAN